STLSILRRLTARRIRHVRRLLLTCSAYDDPPARPHTGAPDATPRPAFRLYPHRAAGGHLDHRVADRHPPAGPAPGPEGGPERPVPQPTTADGGRRRGLQAGPQQLHLSPVRERDRAGTLLDDAPGLS